MKKAVFRKLHANVADTKKERGEILILKSSENEKSDTLETKSGKESRRKKGDEKCLNL